MSLPFGLGIAACSDGVPSSTATIPEAGEPLNTVSLVISNAEDSNVNVSGFDLRTDGPNDFDIESESTRTEDGVESFDIVVDIESSIATITAQSWRIDISLSEGDGNVDPGTYFVGGEEGLPSAEVQYSQFSTARVLALDDERQVFFARSGSLTLNDISDREFSSTLRDVAMAANTDENRTIEFDTASGTFDLAGEVTVR